MDKNTATTYEVSREQLKLEANNRKLSIANRQASIKALPAEERVKAFIEDRFSADNVKKIPVVKGLESITDPRMRIAMEDAVVKAVSSYDLTGIRFVSYYDQTAELANQETIFRTLVEANGIVRSTDFQIRWRENYANTDAVAFFNLNAGLPAEAQMARAVRGNTMGAYGNQLNIRFITDELASQSPIAPTDERATQLRMQLIRMKRFSNSKLLANSEQNSEIVGDTPQWGGFYTRSTANALATAGDLTSALIQAQTNSIANASSVEGLGYHIPLVCLTTSAQIAKVRDLMIARFPGENSNTYLDYQARLSAMLPGVNISPDMVQFFRANPGGSQIFIHEPQLTAGVALWLVPGLPRIAKFQMMGQMGPWSLERPTPELTTLLAVFDFESLIDPLLASRASYSGLN